MPTVFHEKGYQFFFVSSDAREPVHIHVAKQGNLCKIWLSPLRTAYNYGFKPHELQEITRIVAAHQTMIHEKWTEYFRK